MNIRDVHIVTNNDYVVCQICKAKLQKIDGRHTKKKHGITFIEYKNKFPTFPTITNDKLEKELKMIEKRKVAKKAIENKQKYIQCCNPECKSDSFLVNINVSTNHTLCAKCKKLGIINPKNVETYQKFVDSMMKQYGVKNPSELEEVQKIKKINLAERLKDNPGYFKPIVKRRKSTNKKNFGDEWKQVLHEKSKQGMKIKYGIEFALQNEKFKKKAQDTYFKETGYKISFENPDVQQAIRDTHFRNRGVIHPMQDPNVAIIVSQKLVKDWADPEKRTLREQAYTIKFIPRLLKFLESKGLELLEKYQNAHYSHRWKCNKCGYEFKQNWNSIQCGFTCPNCRPYVSKNEKYKTQKEIADFVQDLGFEIVRDNRSLIGPYELDILIHSKKIAIEYCGFWWHNEEIIRDTRKKINNPKNYHLQKLQWCIEKGYQLITIFEDEWLFKKDIVKSRLKQILGKTTAERIHARKCEIFEITPKAKNDFLNNFHIQGKDNSSVYLGAFYGDIMCAVMTFSKGSISKGSVAKDHVWELNRFCSNSNYHIPGIAGKLLEYFKRNWQWEEIFSYADRRWSNGNLYYKLNFDFVRVTQPNYWYLDINKIKRYHRFALRKQPNEPKEISERILRISEGYKIIWDCGSFKFILKNT